MKQNNCSSVIDKDMMREWRMDREGGREWRVQGVNQQKI